MEAFTIKPNTKHCLSLHYNTDNSEFFANGKEVCKFQANNKNVNFLAHFMCMNFQLITILLINLTY